MNELTRILAEAEQREQLTADELLGILYDELRAEAQTDSVSFVLSFHSA